ncbi:MAG: MFS transporter [Thermoflexus sp.]|nr:MFS transporter [Thermoflexus sp.]
MLAGAWFWRTLSNCIGRKLGFILAALIDSGFGLLSAFSPNFAALALLRALTGFGVGGTLPLDNAIFAEHLPRQQARAPSGVSRGVLGLGGADRSRPGLVDHALDGLAAVAGHPRPARPHRRPASSCSGG